MPPHPTRAERLLSPNSVDRPGCAPGRCRRRATPRCPGSRRTARTSPRVPAARAGPASTRRRRPRPPPARSTSRTARPYPARSHSSRASVRREAPEHPRPGRGRAAEASSLRCLLSHTRRASAWKLAVLVPRTGVSAVDFDHQRGQGAVLRLRGAIASTACGRGSFGRTIQPSMQSPVEQTHRDEPVSYAQ